MSFTPEEQPSFKEKQLDYYTVFQAFRDKGDGAYAKLKAMDVNHSNFDLLIRAFKFEEDLEVWAKNKDESIYKLVSSYKFCSNVGDLGPKRKEGDKQIPEGIYKLSKFNPSSAYFLSLKVDYPNASDKVLSDPYSPGGLIFIHGGCKTIGCIPITDEWIKELYVFSVLAKDGGQGDIPIHIFPARLTDENFKLIARQYNNPDLHKFWRQLKNGFDLFEENHEIPETIVTEHGDYLFR